MWATRGAAAAIAWTVLFVAWTTTGAAQRPSASALDLVFFTPLGVATGVLMLVAGVRSVSRRDRWAWGLLGAACLTRVGVGVLWKSLTAAGQPIPDWSGGLSLLRCAMEILGLALFVSARRQRSDQVRYALDAATIIIGIAVVEWYFGLSRVFASDPLAAAARAASGPAEYAVLLSGSICALLSALLYLRRSDARVRGAAVCLILAFSLQATSDSLQWTGSMYVPGDGVTAWWWATWLLKLCAAKLALEAPEAPADVATETAYRSGAVPLLFLAGANLVLWWEMAKPHDTASQSLVVATSLLTALLVVRQAVELRENASLGRTLVRDEARFGALVQHSYDAVVLMLTNGGASYVSPATKRLLGDNPAFDEPWGLLAAVHPDDAAALQRALTNLTSPSKAHTCRVRTADGSWRVFSLRLQDLTTDPLVGAIAIHGHDVTRESALARRLREAEEVEALGVFAGGLAHDLNNVLGAIGMHVDLLLEQAPPGGGVRLELDAIRRATARSATLTRNLLTLSRRKVALFEAVDVRMVLRERLRGMPHQVEGQAPILARIDRGALDHALDAIAGSVHPGVPEAADWQVDVSTLDVDAERAAALDIEPGAFVVVRCASAPTAASHGAAAQLDRRPGQGEDLDVLLARAVLREMGGTLSSRHGLSSDQVIVYLPAVRA